MNLRQYQDSLFVQKNCKHENINLQTGECFCGFIHNHAPLKWNKKELVPVRVEDEIKQKFDDFDRRHSIYKYKMQKFKLNKMRFIANELEN